MWRKAEWKINRWIIRLIKLYWIRVVNVVWCLSVSVEQIDKFNGLKCTLTWFYDFLGSINAFGEPVGSMAHVRWCIDAIWLQVINSDSNVVLTKSNYMVLSNNFIENEQESMRQRRTLPISNIKLSIQSNRNYFVLIRTCVSWALDGTKQWRCRVEANAIRSMQLCAFCSAPHKVHRPAVNSHAIRDYRLKFQLVEMTIFGRTIRTSWLQLRQRRTLFRFYFWRTL